jgi:hypothetical protein
VSNKPFDREVWNTREKPLSTDHNYLATFLDETLRDLVAIQLMGYRIGAAGGSDTFNHYSTGFIGSGFYARPTVGPSMNVTLDAGLGWKYDPIDLPFAVGGIVGVDDRCRMKPLPLQAQVSLAVPGAPAPGQNRIDIIEVNAVRRLGDSATRGIFNAATRKFDPLSVKKGLLWDLTDQVGSAISPAPSTSGISYVQGVPAAPGAEVAPAVTTGYVKIAEIWVQGGAASIDADVIKDTRPLSWVHGMAEVKARILLQNLAGVMLATVQRVVGPPGTLLASTGILAAGALLDVFLIAGDSALGASALAATYHGMLNIAGATGVTHVTEVLTGGGLGFVPHVITAAEAALLIDPTRSLPVLKVPGTPGAGGWSGQPCRSARLGVYDTAGAHVLAPGQECVFQLSIGLGR